MATLSKKFYMSNVSGTQHAALLYSTPNEAGKAYAHLVVDSVPCYLPLVSTSHEYATIGRVQESSGTLFAVSSQRPVPAYTTVNINYATTGTFTVPTGVKRLRVTCVGGGAEGAARTYRHNGEGCSSSEYRYTWLAAGGRTSFGNIYADGGTSICFEEHWCNTSIMDEYGEWHPVTLKGKFWVCEASYGFHNGGTLHSETDYLAGGAAVPLQGYNGSVIFYAGAGGGCTGSEATPVLGSGASGYRTQAIIDVTPGTVFSYTVGAGGGNGSPGGLLIEYGDGIQS